MKFPLKFVNRFWKPISPAIRESMELGGTAIAKTGTGLERLFGQKIKLNPEMRLFTSAASKTREFAENVLRRDFAQEKNFSGKESRIGIETEYNLGYETMLGSSSENLSGLYDSYRNRVKGQVDPASRNILDEYGRQLGKEEVFQKKNHLSKKQFNIEAGKAMRRFTMGDTSPHPIPEINKVAQYYKDNIFTPMFDRLVDLKLIGEKLKKNQEFVASYFSQIHDIESIKTNTKEYIDLNTEIFSRDKKRKITKKTERIQDLDSKLEKAKTDSAKKKLKRLRNKAVKSLKEITKRDPRQEAIDLMNNVLGQPYGMSPRPIDLMDKGRHLKSRRVIIPKDLLAKYEKFLVNDVEEVSMSYLRNTLPRALFKERFGKSLKEVQREVADEYDRLIQDPRISQEEKYRLHNQKRSDARDISAVVDRLLGRYALPEDPYSITQRISNSLLKLNTITKLGRVVFSSVPDLARTTMRYGLPRTLKTLATVISDTDMAKMAMQDLKKNIGIYEILLQHRFYENAEIHRGFHSTSRLERMIDSMFSNFGVMSLITPWNQGIKQFAALNVANQIIDMGESLAKGTGVAKLDLTKALESGLNEGMLRRIYDQFQKYGINHNGTYIPQSANWADRSAANAFNNAIRREVDVAIANPGIGSRPLLASTTAGKHVFQFKSFSLTITQAALLSGLQYKDAAAISGMMMSVYLGTMVYLGYEHMAGREPDYDWRTLAINGIDRSGIMGWMMDANTIIERASRGTIGVNPMIGTPGTSKYRAQDIFSLLGGPTSGTVGNMVRTAGAISKREFTEGDIRAFRRLIPYQNLIYLQWLTDRLESGLVEAIGTEE